MKHFQSKKAKNETIAKNYLLKKWFVDIYHPQTDGLTERFNKTLIAENGFNFMWAKTTKILP